MLLTRAICLAVLTTTLTGLARPALAAPPTVAVRAHQLQVPVKRRVWVASRPGADPAAITSRPMGLHTHTADLVAVRVVNTTIYLDPNADYTHQGEHRIDSDHTIVAAQRLYRSLNAKPARVIRKDPSHRHRVTAAAGLIVPRAVITKPSGKQPSPKAKKIQIPSVPGPPKKKPSRLMAYAAH